MSQSIQEIIQELQSTGFDPKKIQTLLDSRQETQEKKSTYITPYCRGSFIEKKEFENRWPKTFERMKAEIPCPRCKALGMFNLEVETGNTLIVHVWTNEQYGLLTQEQKDEINKQCLDCYGRFWVLPQGFKSQVFS